MYYDGYPATHFSIQWLWHYAPLYYCNYFLNFAACIIARNPKSKERDRT
jgi:hypothetical protein